MRDDTPNTAAIFSNGHLTMSWLVALLVGTLVGSYLAPPPGVLVAVGYGCVATFSWQLARRGRPLLATAVAGFNAFVLLQVALFPSRNPAYVGVKVAFTMLVALAAVVCMGLWFLRWPERDS